MQRNICLPDVAFGIDGRYPDEPASELVSWNFYWPFRQLGIALDGQEERGKVLLRQVARNSRDESIRKNARQLLDKLK